jgi:hypothetical protein
MEDLKLKPYDRLQSIFSNDKELTESASKKLDYLLSGDKSSKKSFLGILKSFLNKIDSFIFRKDGIYNTTYYKRKK